MNHNNSVLIKHPKNWGLDEGVVENIAGKILKESGLDGVELSLYFVGRKKARDLNIQYRKMDYVPQVLAFPMDKEPCLPAGRMLGDIIICTPKLKHEAKFSGRKLEVILGEWLGHGIGNLVK